MTESSERNSENGSECQWQTEHQLERSPSEQVLFENIPDQYVKGDDVTVFFTVIDDSKVNIDTDKIGLKQIGYTKAKDCIAFTPVQLTPATSTGSARQGTATFASTALPENDEEFYQFCYIIDANKILGSSLPFQLNCSPVNLDLLNDATGVKDKSNSYLAFADQDQDGLVVIQTKEMFTVDKLRQENRQLIDLKRRLEIENEEFRERVSLVDAGGQQQIEKLTEEMKDLIGKHAETTAELEGHRVTQLRLIKEYEECQELCKTYKDQSLEKAQRCSILEDAQTQVVNEANVVRSQLAVASQLIKEQATQIVELQHRLMQSDEISKGFTERQNLLELQLRDLNLTSEKNQRSMEGQIEAQMKDLREKHETIGTLESTNDLLKQEVVSSKEENQRLNNEVEQEKRSNEELRTQIEQLSGKHQAENEANYEKLEQLRNGLASAANEQESAQILRVSLQQLKDKCLKYQKSDVENRKQLRNFQSVVEMLKAEVDDSKGRLQQAEEEYKRLQRKFLDLEREKRSTIHREEAAQMQAILAPDNVPQINPLDAALENQYLLNTFEDDCAAAAQPPSLDDDGEVKACPVCYIVFADHFTIEAKREHIERHFSMLPT